MCRHNDPISLKIVIILDVEQFQTEITNRKSIQNMTIELFVEKGNLNRATEKKNQKLTIIPHLRLN